MLLKTLAVIFLCQRGIEPIPPLSRPRKTFVKESVCSKHHRYSLHKLSASISRPKSVPSIYNIYRKPNSVKLNFLTVYHRSITALSLFIHSLALIPPSGRCTNIIHTRHLSSPLSYPLPRAQPRHAPNLDIAMTSATVGRSDVRQSRRWFQRWALVWESRRGWR
jgi:hypothetical protein